MSMMKTADSGVKPETSSVRPEGFEEGCCPLSCACPDCQAELDWIAMQVRALEELESALARDEPDPSGAPEPSEGWDDCFAPAYWERELGEPDGASLDATDYAYWSGYTLGYQAQPADPPRGYSDLEIVAWFGGYHAGQTKWFADVIDELNDREAHERLLPDPGRDWHEEEIARSHSNGGHPAWEEGR